MLYKLSNKMIEINRINRINIPDESQYGYPTGWVCPKCGRVYGPNERECPYCNKRDYTITCLYFQH